MKDYYYIELPTSLSEKNAKLQMQQEINVAGLKLFYKPAGKNKKDAKIIVCCKADSENDFCDIFGKSNKLCLKNSQVKKASNCDIEDKRIKEKHRVVCFSDNENNRRYKKVLFLGTHITEKSIEKGFFYLGVNNCFWELVSSLYENNPALSSESSPERLYSECQNLHIAIADIIGSCKCVGSKDDFIIEETIVINKYLKPLLQEADIIVINGKGLKKGKELPMSARYFFRKYVATMGNFNADVKYVLGSPPGSPGKEKKKEDWKSVIGSVFK